jgi:hypothetical protein
VTLNNVASNPDGAPLWSCFISCTSSACIQGCYGQHPSAAWDLGGLVTCSRNDCASECGFAPASCGSITLTDPSCDGCVAQNCCAERSACGAADACDAFIYQCLDRNSCPDAVGACANACRTQYDAGTGPFDALRFCALAQCPTQCAGL